MFAELAFVSIALSVLDELSEQTQREIAEALDISRSYVSRIEKKALQKIMEEMVKI